MRRKLKTLLVIALSAALIVTAALTRRLFKGFPLGNKLTVVIVVGQLSELHLRHI